MRSNVSSDSNHQSQRSTPLYTRLAPLYRCVQSLKTKVGGLQVTIPKSFDIVRGEFDEVWTELAKVRPSRHPAETGASSSLPFFQQRAQSTQPLGPTSTSLSPASFQRLMRQVIKSFRHPGMSFGQTRMPVLPQEFRPTLSTRSSTRYRASPNASSTWRMHFRIPMAQWGKWIMSQDL